MPRIEPLADGSFRFDLKGYQETSATATLAEMSVQILIGDDAFVTTSTWSPLRRGWRVQLP